jgi:hypothetical protein
MSETFEHNLKAAQVTGSMTLAWKKFIKAKFFVAILRSPDDDPKNFLLSITRRPGDGKPVVIIAEVRDRIDQHQGDGVVAISGADIVRRLGDQGGILVELSDGPFHVSRKRVSWLRSGIEVAEARVKTRKVLNAAAPGAPLPVLSVQGGLIVSSAAPAPQPVSAPTRARRSLEALAALHLPKPEKTGLEFFEPSAWQGSAPAPAAPAAQLTRVKQLAGSLPVVLTVLAVAVGLAFFLLTGNSEPAEPEAVPARVDVAARPPAPVAAAPAVTAAALPAESTAIRFAPADNSFGVSVPGMPEELELTPEQVEQMGELRMHQYKLVTGARIYTMQATDYGERLPADLNGAMDGMQSSIVGQDGTLVRASSVQLRGAIGREVRVQLANGAVRAARFAFVGSKFCMVAVVAANGQQSAAEIDTFLNSFQLN